jgi:hypothetical protein
MKSSVRVFISSTWQDLKPEREAVEKALNRIQNTTFNGMEYFGSRSETTKEASLLEVNRSNIYIGIFANRYGSGITEAEYREAQKKELPCLIYFKDEYIPVLPDFVEREPDKLAKLNSLKNELMSKHTVSFFKNPDQLATQIVSDLHNLFVRNLLAQEETPTQSDPMYQINISEGKGIVIGDNSHVIQNFRPQVSSKISQSNLVRLEHLLDNIRQDLGLLKDYEDALRYEGDPRQRMKYLREIEQLRESSLRNQNEYESLRSQLLPQSSDMMNDVGLSLQQMDTKLDNLIIGQSLINSEIKSLRQTVLSTYESGIQTIIATLLERLNKYQLTNVLAVQEAIELGEDSEKDLLTTLTMVNQSLCEVLNNQAEFHDPNLVSGIKHISKTIDDPSMDVRHRLKITIPIIPILLSYEGEIEISSGMNLANVWDRFVAKIKGMK